MRTTETTPLRQHAADLLRRARRTPLGAARNDLRQLAISLLYLEKRGIIPSPGAIATLREAPEASAASHQGALREA